MEKYVSHHLVSPQDPGGGNGAGNSAAPGGNNNEQMTPMGMGVIGGLASSNPSSAPECGDLAELSQADLKGLVGEITEEDEIFTSISDPNFELDNIFAEVSVHPDWQVYAGWIKYLCVLRRYYVLMICYSLFLDASGQVNVVYLVVIFLLLI